LTYTFIDIKKFLEDQVGCDDEEITESCDIVNDLGCYGDDFFELMFDFSKKFNVDMTPYLWYFHTKEWKIHAN
jgi:acyl carrier protein